MMRLVIREADADEIASFALTEAGEMAVSKWGRDAKFRVAAVRDRYDRLESGLDDNGRKWLAHLVDNMDAAALAAVFKNLAR